MLSCALTRWMHFSGKWFLRALETLGTFWLAAFPGKARWTLINLSCQIGANDFPKPEKLLHSLNLHIGLRVNSK